MMNQEGGSMELKALVINPDGTQEHILPKNGHFTQEELEQFFVGDFVIDLFYNSDVMIHEENLEVIDWDDLTEKRSPDFFSVPKQEALEYLMDDIDLQVHEVNRKASLLKMHLEDEMIFPVTGRAIYCSISLLDRCVLRLIVYRKYLQDKEFIRKVESMR